MLAPSRPGNTMVATSIINKRWCQVDLPTGQLRPLLINVCQHTDDKSTIQSTRAGIGKQKTCICSCQLCIKLDFCCGDYWKLQQLASKAPNMMENALSILIVIFSKQLQQTEISERKLFIFQHSCSVGITPQMCNRVTNPWDMGIFSRPGSCHPGTPCKKHTHCIFLWFTFHRFQFRPYKNTGRKKYSLLRVKYFCEDSRIYYLSSKSLNMRSEWGNIKNVINIRAWFSISA